MLSLVNECALENRDVAGEYPEDLANRSDVEEKIDWGKYDLLQRILVYLHAHVLFQSGQQKVQYCLD